MRRRPIRSGEETLWLVLLLITNLFFAFIIWLAAPQAFGKLTILIVLFTAAIFFIGHFIHLRKQKNQMAAMEAFLCDLDQGAEQKLLDAADPSWHPILRTVSAQLRQQERAINDKQMELKNYQEFIEAWAHQMKTPLSLATLVLDNHKEEMSPYVHQRMEHVRCTIHGNIEKILYYARLFADHPDDRFETINLNDCINECMENFRAIAEEKGICLHLQIACGKVVSDKKVLMVMISQLLSNAFQYTPPQGGMVHIVSWQESCGGRQIHLAIRDNGRGIPEEDAPFLFDKGFTGNHPDRQNATGMGLYLVKKYAQRLSIEVNVGAASTSGSGFEIELVFPNVEKGPC